MMIGEQQVILQQDFTGDDFQSANDPRFEGPTSKAEYQTWTRTGRLSAWYKQMEK